MVTLSDGIICQMASSITNGASLTWHRNCSDVLRVGKQKRCVVFPNHNCARHFHQVCNYKALIRKQATFLQDHIFVCYINYLGPIKYHS